MVVVSPRLSFSFFFLNQNQNQNQKNKKNSNNNKIGPPPTSARQVRRLGQSQGRQRLLPLRRGRLQGIRQESEKLVYV